MWLLVEAAAAGLSAGGSHAVREEGALEPGQHQALMDRRRVVDQQRPDTHRQTDIQTRSGIPGQPRQKTFSDIFGWLPYR